MAQPSCDVSVIVPHYNDLRGLSRCLDALCAQTGLDELTHEIIVADNNSPVDRVELEQVIAGRARLVIELEKGAGPARNAGVREARGARFAFTDSDCVPEPDWLAAGHRALQGADFVGGRMRVSVNDEKRINGVEGLEKVFAFDNEAYVKQKGFTVTANLFCDAETFAAVGPFKTEVSEDLEWCHRARDKGYRLAYAPDAVVAHPARATWQQLKTKWRRINRETYAFNRQNGHGIAHWLGRSWLLPLSILPHAVKAMRSPELDGPQARLRTVATLARHRMWRLVDAHRIVLASKEDV